MSDRKNADKSITDHVMFVVNRDSDFHRPRLLNISLVPHEIMVRLYSRILEVGH